MAIHTLFVYTRPGIVLSWTEEKNVVLVNAPQIAVSSTDIRWKVRKGINLSGDVPERVVKMIEKYYGR